MAAALDVAVIDAGGANLGSVCYALERLGVVPRVIRTADELDGAARVILPGVGAAAPGMARLREQGLVEPLRQLKAPLLGVCLGMQLLYEASEESDTRCLGVLPGRVARMLASPALRLPHMGWNTLEYVRDVPLMEGIRDGDQVYFVHGYAAPLGHETVAATTHGAPFSAVVQYRNFYGVQFHPERSAAVGARVLENFVRGLA